MNIPARLLLLMSALFASTAQATTFYIDNFEITQDNQTIFNDSFEDGTTPSTGYSPPGGNDLPYFTRPSPLPGPEASGKLELDTADGDLRFSSVGGVPILIQQGRVITPQDANGLTSSVDFSTTGVFDLIEPTLPGQEFYGIRLTDFAGNNDDPNDNTQLRVHVSPSGDWRVWFVEAVGDAFVTLGAVVLNDQLLVANNIIGSLTDYDQIALTLTHEIPAGAGSSQSVTASFTLLDLTSGGLANLAVDVGGAATLFDGEDWTRAGFLAVQRVPVPPTFALLGLGIAGFVWRRREAKHIH